MTKNPTYSINECRYLIEHGDRADLETLREVMLEDAKLYHSVAFSACIMSIAVRLAVML